MKYLLSLILLTNIAFASYIIEFKGLEIGEIKNFNSLEQNYLEADVTNSIARFLLGKDKFVFYNEDYNGLKNDDNTKYKKDKYAIIYILKKAAANNTKDERLQIKENKYIDIKFDTNYKFKYTSKDKIKSEGFFVMKDGKLETFIEEVNSINIIKKEVK
ncbi:MAG: hypothetical protein ACERKK_03820 [Poseidonibacter sp.]|uniref:hypothetical protein n=1 Tax=Poseidonibacter sp. TaxID=2321188 RepID=UPI00359D86A8